MKLFNQSQLLSSFIAILLMLAYSTAISQEFERINTSIGLSSNNIKDIVQDKEGVIWIATTRGLNSYDGYRVKSYLHEANTPSSLINNHIQTLCITKNGVLIIGTQFGISIYNRALDNFSNYKLDFPSTQGNMLNYINKIQEDNYGGVWVACAEGMFKFNVEQGTFEEFFRHEVFYHISKNELQELKASKIPTEIIKKVETLALSFFNSHKHLREKVKNTIGEIDFKQYGNTILDITTQSKEPFYPSSVNTFAIDEKDQLWLGLSNGHIIKTTLNNNHCELAYFENNRDVESNLYSLYVNDNKIWCGNVARGMIYDIEKNRMVKSYNPVLTEIFSKQGLCFSQAHQNNKIWIGTNRGLFLYDKNTQKAISYNNDYFNPASLSSDVVSIVFTDKQNNVWIATQDAGVCLKKNINPFISYIRLSKNQQQIIDNKTTSILIDKKGNTWVAILSGGINVFNKNGKMLHSFENNPNDKTSLGKGRVTGIVIDKKGTIWVSTYFGGIQKYNEKAQSFYHLNLSIEKKHQPHIMQLACDSSNNLWANVLGIGIMKINSDRETMYRFHIGDTNYTPKLANNWVKLIQIIPNNKFTFYTNGLIYSINEENKTIEKLIQDHNLFNYTIKCFKYNNKNQYYIGTNTGLLTNALDNTLKEVELLKNIEIQSLEQDNNGNLWIGSQTGLYKLIIAKKNNSNDNSFTLKHYKKEDGLPSNHFSENTSYKTHNGTLYFGTERGSFSFHPDSLKENPTPPNVILTDFKLFNQSIKPDTLSILKKHINQTQKIELNHNQNFISFSFAAINYINPEANQYAYKLVGVDNDWIYCGNKREANYTKLRHGNYVFRVKASNNDNVWNNTGTSVEVVIKPPFWKTNWAMLLYALVVFIVFMMLSYLIRYQEKFKAKLQMEHMSIEKDNQLNKMKLQFFTNISHEFRTPLTLILGPLEGLIQKNKEDSKQLSLIYRNAKKLLKLIDEILDVRKLNSGKMTLNLVRTELIFLSKNIITDFKYQCESKQVDLIFDHPTETLEAHIDVEKYETILSNLLSNAIKFTPKNGKIIVHLKPTTDKKNDMFMLMVEDTGCGIPQSDVEYIFERFYQSKNLKNGGSGIGLALVKELTAMHNGEVSIESEVNKGSTFKILFPTNNNNKAETNQALNTADLESKTVQTSSKVKENTEQEITDTFLNETDENLPLILVVEDNDEVRNYIIDELKSLYRIIEAANGKDAYEVTKEKYPDIIISDVMMPEMDGIELSKKLKQDEKTSHIPIVLLTAYNNENNNIAGYETGAESFLAKPFSPKVLRSRINNILKNRERLKEKFSNILYAIPSNKSISAVDEEFLQKAIKIVEENLVEEKFNIEFLCKEIGYSRTALYSKIKALTDQSISEFIKLIRLKKSIEYFQKGQKTINEVAFLIGFKTHAHFSRCFQEEFNMSPSEYIEKLNKKKK